MMLTAQETTSNDIVAPVVVIVLLIASTFYLFGYRRAVMHRANRDYKTTKAAVKPLRKGFWTAWWAAVKIGFWFFLIVFALVAWAARSGDRKVDVNTTPSPTVSQTHKR